MPNFPHCAFKDAQADDMGLMADYMMLWNILHYPSGSMPITQVLKDEEEFEDNHNDGWTKCMKETTKGSQGMPISVQVVAHAWEDEKALAVMQAIEKGVNYTMPIPT